MAAANEGTRRVDPHAHNRSVGIRVQLPFEQDVNAFVSQAYEHRTFFTRLHQFVLMSDAFVVMPGGIGTVLEAMMIWQLLQVGHLQDTPLILVGKMYAELVAWCQHHMLQPKLHLANPDDIALPRCVNDGQGILEILRVHHTAWVEARNQKTSG
jgi:predicted Rossmann-fold nucleotide-binding protein